MRHARVSRAPPEIISNKGHGLGADWWTLGILLYEMLVGNPPFAADNQMDIYHKIMRGKYKVPSHFPKAAKEIVSRLLSSNPAARLGCLKSGSKEVLPCSATQPSLTLTTSPDN